MAENADKLNEEQEVNETEELERLLDQAEGPPAPNAAEGGGGEGFLKKITGKLLTSKKMLILAGGGFLVLLLLAGGAYYFLYMNPAGQPAEVEEPVSEETKQPGKKEVPVAKDIVYALEPFFLPLRSEGRETGRFVTVTPNLLLSNQALDKEIRKVLPTVRKNIYNVLIRKHPRDYLTHKQKIEEKIKKEILVSVNPLLLPGTGTIKDVFFTRFVVK